METQAQSQNEGPHGDIRGDADMNSSAGGGMVASREATMKVEEIISEIKKKLRLIRSYKLVDTVEADEMWSPYAESARVTVVEVDTRFECTLIVAQAKEKTRFEEHIHLEDLDFYVVRGHVEMRIKGKSYTLKDNTCISVKSNVPHEIYFLEDTLFTKTFDPPLPRGQEKGNDFAQ